MGRTLYSPVIALAILLSLSLITVESARILCVFTIPSRSHTNAYKPLVEELAKRGHEVVVITTDPVKNGGPEYENITQIDISFMYKIKLVGVDDEEGEAKTDFSISKIIRTFTSMLCNLADNILQSPEVQQLIHDKEQHFDVVIAEWYSTGPVYGFSHHFKAPLIGISSGQSFSWTLDAIGNPDHPIENPDVFLPFYKNLTFIERLTSVAYSSFIRVLYYYIVLPIQDEISKKHFGEDTPYIGDLEKDVQLLILNFHAALGHTRPKVPGVIYTGSMHIRPKKPLPKELKSYLDEANEGVIYFSLGSNVKSSDMTEEKLEVFLSAFKELPYKVLWKWETDVMPGKPENVKLSKWLPQQDLLGHPNVKVFITQGGQQSMEEAIDNRVPVLGVPFMVDQYRNAQKFVEYGIGETLNFKTIKKEELIITLKKLIQDPKYKKNQVNLRELINDEPMTSLERGCWWIEHVIRHKGARHLRSNILDIPLYQYLFLDIIAFVVVVTLILSYINYKLFKCLINILCKKYRRRQDFVSDKKIN